MNEYQYQPIDHEVILNADDPSLFPIHIDQLDLIRRTYRQYNQPEPDDFPAMELVDGYGLPPEQQVFQREVIPQGIIELERAIRKELKPKGKARDLTPVRREIAVLNRFWEDLENNQEKYSSEIEWINKMWYYRLLGKHLFINGKHTYLPGFFWWFLNVWYLNSNNLPEYRDRDRRWAIALKYADVNTETFANIDPDSGVAIKNEYEEYDMTDTGHRVFYGCNFPKTRRVGDTSRLECALTEFATRKVGGKSGIQAKDDTTAETVFQEHMVQPFIKLPIFWKPVFDTSAGLVPKNGITFDDFSDLTFGLHSIIEVATSSDKAKFDGKYLDMFHGDEFGKLQRSDVNQVAGVVKYCLSTGGGSNIHGLSGITSTCDEVDDMTAGENYMKFCQRSHFERRNMNGQTSSGWFNVFFRAEDALEGYVGPYGESIIENPTTDQIRHTGKKIGSRQFIDNTIAALRRDKDYEGLALFRRQHPQCYLDIFTPPPKNQVLRRDLIEQQLAILQSNPEMVAVRGDFDWVGGIFDGAVGWYPNAESGKFYLSRKFLSNETNRKVYRDNMYCPAYSDRFLLSADTFGQSKTLGRKSNGGIIARWNRDFVNDPEAKDMALVESDRDILTYSYRPPTVEEFCEDVLKAAIYMGALIYPERNRTNIMDHVIRRGYGGYLLYDHDRNTGKRKPNPGWWNKDEIVAASIRWLADDVVKNVSRCYHPDLLKEYLEFGGAAYLTDCDLIASKLGLLIGIRNPFYQMVKGHNNQIDVSGWIPFYDD